MIIGEKPFQFKLRKTKPTQAQIFRYFRYESRYNKKVVIVPLRYTQGIGN